MGRGASSDDGLTSALRPLIEKVDGAPVDEERLSRAVAAMCDPEPLGRKMAARAIEWLQAYLALTSGEGYDEDRAFELITGAANEVMMARQWHQLS